jgi:hypothetical protein
MAAKKKPKLTEAEQSARELGADETGKAFERGLKAVLSPKKEQSDPA